MGGITLAVAIAIHNIPEGLCVALPVYYATGSRHKGFFWALLSGLSEPIGAILGWALLKGTGGFEPDCLRHALWRCIGHDDHDRGYGACPHRLSLRPAGQGLFFKCCLGNG